jgi:hypothetical protein
MKISKPQELIMEVETPMPPLAMNTRRPEGRPAAGIITVEKVITDSHGSGVSSRSSAFLQSRKAESDIHTPRPAG